MQQDLVSVIIPAYNASATIERCINSVLTQTYSPIEIVVVNDGSKDNTAEILEQLQAHHVHSVRVLHQQNQGVSVARNHAIQESKGRYLCFLDSDDEYYPEYVARGVQAICSGKSEMVISAFNTMKGKREVAEVDYIDKAVERLSTDAYLDIMLEYHDQAYWGANWNKVFLASIIKDNQIQFQPGVTIGEDLYFNLQYMKHVQHISVLHTCSCRYQLDTEGSLSKLTRNAEDYWKQYVYIYSAYSDLCTRHGAGNIKRLPVFAQRMLFDTLFMAANGSHACFEQFRMLCKSVAEYRINCTVEPDVATNWLHKQTFGFMRKKYYLCAFTLMKLEAVRRSRLRCR